MAGFTNPQRICWSIKEIKAQNYLVFFIFWHANVAVLNITLKYCLNPSFNFQRISHLAATCKTLQNILGKKKKKESLSKLLILLGWDLAELCCNRLSCVFLEQVIAFMSHNMNPCKWCSSPGSTGSSHLYPNKLLILKKPVRFHVLHGSCSSLHHCY